MPLFRAYGAKGLAKQGRFEEAERIALASYERVQELPDNEVAVPKILASIITVFSSP